MIKNATVQGHNFGCGAACVAFIFDWNYKNALKLFINGRQKAKQGGFLCKEIVRAFSKRNISTRHKYINEKIRKKIYKENAVVFIARSKKYPAGHYLCRYKNFWMDPWISFQKNQNIKRAIAGFRKKLPGKPIYAILPLLRNPVSNYNI